MQRCDTHLLRLNEHLHRSQIPTCPPHAPFHSALPNRLLKSLRKHDGTEVSRTFPAVSTEARSICDLASLTAIVPCSGEAGASRTHTSNYQAATAWSMPTLACVEDNSNPDCACRARWLELCVRADSGRVGESIACALGRATMTNSRVLSLATVYALHVSGKVVGSVKVVYCTGSRTKGWTHWLQCVLSESKAEQRPCLSRFDGSEARLQQRPKGAWAATTCRERDSTTSSTRRFARCSKLWDWCELIERRRSSAKSPKTNLDDLKEDTLALICADRTLAPSGNRAKLIARILGRGGACICPHQRIRSACKECGGASICQHQRKRSECKECVGVGFCQHQRSTSQECGEGSICQHQRQKSTCKERGGAGPA
jgi:hypothetical protein